MDYEAELRAVLARYLADESRSDMSSNRDFSVRQIVECMIDDLLEQDNDEVAEEMIRFAREHPEATESELFEHYEDQWDPPEIIDDEDYEAELRAVLARYLADESSSPMNSNTHYTVHEIVEMLIEDILDEDDDEVAEEMIRFAKENPEATDMKLYLHFDSITPPPEIIDDDEWDEE